MCRKLVGTTNALLFHRIERPHFATGNSRFVSREYQHNFYTMFFHTTSGDYYYYNPNSPRAWHFAFKNDSVFRTFRREPTVPIVSRFSFAST